LVNAPLTRGRIRSLLALGTNVTRPIFANLDGLLRLAREHGVDTSPTLLRVLTDLYVQQTAHSQDEERQFTEMALRLLDNVDDDTRAIVARKLTSCPATPAAVMARIAMPDFSRVMAATAETQPTRTADTDEGQLSGSDFFSANPDERRRILADIPATASRPTLPRDIASAARQLETCAMNGKAGEFTRVLARALRIPERVAQRIVNDPSGEPLLVAAKALAMPREVFQRIVLFVNPAVGHSVRRVYDLSDLYPEVTVQQALHLVGLWRENAPAQSRPAYQPYFWNDESRRARDSATPSHTPVPAARPAVADRPRFGKRK
jgi:Uncharacterised protein conserved in bacteria (DUF2336)